MKYTPCAASIGGVFCRFLPGFLHVCCSFACLPLPLFQRLRRSGFALCWLPMLRTKLVFAIVIFLLPSRFAAAQQTKSENPFSTNLTIELPLLLGGMALWFGPVLIGDELPANLCAPCDRRNVNRIDRMVIGNHSHFADVGSDVLAVAIPGVAFVASGFLQRDSFRGIVDDSLIILESMVLSGVLNQIVRHTMQRPRPYMYLDPIPDNKRKNSADDWHSFFSGHTSAAFAASTAFANIYSVRHPNSKWRPWVWTAAMGAASLMAVFRPASGEHFYSDALVGAAVGFAAGTAAPALHHNRSSSFIFTGSHANFSLSF